MVKIDISPFKQKIIDKYYEFRCVTDGKRPWLDVGYYYSCHQWLHREYKSNLLAIEDALELKFLEFEQEEDAVMFLLQWK